ncbi:MAG TPA: DUF6519 domain-containing protein [Ktedonobacterales bacterium]|nr:DUF6519 domain-containing protein [Ktedonobacterales bacterium]
MGSDRARISYDTKQQYRAVVMQQGRVTVEADWNEAQEIINEERRKEALDFVGPCGTPDDGYRVLVTGKPANPAFDFSVQHGTTYVGGVRVHLHKDVTYSSQQEWLDQSSDPDWVDPASIDHARSQREYVYLSLREQEVSAVEDSALREVALGGPDTAQRIHLIQHIVRRATNGDDCASALKEAIQYWQTEGLDFHPDTMRLLSWSRLKASYQDPGAPDPCEPDAHGGYLGADNQLIRVQLAAADTLLWGFDNASFLYRVDVLDNQTLRLQSRPVDVFHRPRANQTVEVLRAAAQLSNGEYLAAATGVVMTLTAAYNPDTQQISLPTALPPEYLDAKQTPRVFLRVWEAELPFTSGAAVALGHTGLQVTLQTSGGQPFHVGDYWQIAVRPSTPTEVYPHRYLADFQPPDGPALWVCPLAVIAWKERTFSIVEDCRNPFDNLVDLTKRKLGGCCSVEVRPEDLAGATTLQTIIDQLKGQGEASVCLMPGVYALAAPLRLSAEHAHLTLEGCHEGVIIQAAAGAEAKFLDGMVVLNRADHIILRGLEFQLPLAPFLQASGALAGLDEQTANQLLGIFLQDLSTSVGVRALQSAFLTVRDCRFTFSLSGRQNVFGAGIFAGGECQGLVVEGNQFSYAGQALQVFQQPLGLLFGLLITPSAIVQTQTSGTATGTNVPRGTLVPSQVQGASFRNNQFAGLTAAALVYATTGMVRVEDNIVRRCYAGFWLFSLRSLAYAELLAQVRVDQQALALADYLRSAILAQVLDPVIQIGSSIAQGYPLPSDFDTSQAIKLDAQTSGAKTQGDTTQMQTLMQKALTLSRGTIASVSTGSDQAANQNTGKATSGTSTPTSSVETSRFNALYLRLSAFARVALAKYTGQPGLTFSLHLANNEIDTRVTSDLSGMDLLVWDDERETASALTMSANALHNQSPTSPAALLLMVERCAITGNLVLNETGGDTAGLSSLDLFPGGTDLAAVAVTGNVFRGTPHLPPRTVPAPLDTWNVLNTQI